jgi:hypothetical protein
MYYGLESRVRVQEGNRVMGSDGFVILAIDSNREGVWALLRCTRCGEPSGFHFESDLFLGRYPLLCECGAEASLDISRPVPGAGLSRELQGAFPWAPILERRLRPRPN